jgi:membrane dipeptidase
MTPMTYFIDAHEDIAYNALTFGRDYTRSAEEIRVMEAEGPNPGRAGQALLGWPNYQRGQVALIFGTLFLAPKRYQGGPWESQCYVNTEDAGRLYRGQIDFYRRLADQSPDQFRLVLTRQDLTDVLKPWEKSKAEYPQSTHPTGIFLSMEGAEGIRHPDELEEYWELGLRAVGPVWAGTRFCGGMYEPGGFSREGYQLLEVMGDLGYILDLAHMTEQSALQALDSYPGTVIASHVNARALLKGFPGERHFTDTTIRKLAERGGVMGVLPFNMFLLPGWKISDDRQLVTLEHVAAHIDYVCQLTGSAEHVAIGTDFDGGFGWPSVPLEINTIADLPKLENLLGQRGYSVQDIHAILHGNWQKILERSLH